MEYQVLSSLPDIFDLVVDGRTTLEAHCIAVFSTYATNTVSGYSSAWLALSAIENKSAQKAVQHANILRFVLEYYGNSE